MRSRTRAHNSRVYEPRPPCLSSIEKPKKDSESTANTAIANGSVVEKTFKALVWKSAEANVCSCGGHAPFCASEPKHGAVAWSILELTMAVKPRSESDMNATRSKRVMNLMEVLSYYRNY